MKRSSARILGERSAKALFGTLLVTLAASADPAAARVGVTSATNGDPLGRPPGENERILRIGLDVQANEVVTTKANDRAHLLFLDGTSLTVGPNAQVVIDRFVFDPATSKGDLAITASKGVFRLVGGKISKSNAITVNTPSSTIGIRGGITLFTVTAVETISSFIFGTSMTVTGQGQTQVATRPGSTIVTNLGQRPLPPVLAGLGAFNSQLAALEGTSAGLAGPSVNTVNQGVQGFANSNSNIVNPVPIQNRNPSGQPNVSNNVLTQAVNNSNPATQPQVQGTPPKPPAPPPTNVIVTQGRYLAQPTFSSFNPVTLAAPAIPANNQPLAPTGTLSGSGATQTATITTSDGRSLVLPWLPGKSFTFTGKGFSGTDSGQGVVGADGNFFAYVLINSSTGQAYGAWGGTPTPTSQFPTGGIAVYNLINGIATGALPFVPGRNPTVEASATTSPLYSIYAPNLGPNASQGAESMQVTMSISGQGISQRSYMGGFIGDYVTDYTTNTIMNAGKYIGSYQANGTASVDRLTASQVTAQTANGNAIYGTGSVPDSMVFVADGAVSTDAGGGTTTRTAQAAMEQISVTSSGSPYTTVTVAVRGETPAGVGTNRTTRTMNGFVGGVIQSIDESGAVSSRVLNVGTSQPGDVSIATDATTNRAQGTITVRNFDGTVAAGSPTAVFQLGSTTGTRRADSAFIDDSVYALSDRKGDPARSSSVQVGGNTIQINSNTIMASYGAAPLQGGKLPGNVTPCECSFLTWGWWSGDVSYDNPGYRQGQRDRLNLATYVAGTLTNAIQLPNTGTATFNGHAVGSVINGTSQYVAAGTFSNVWSFQTQRGQVTIGNFDGATYTGTAALTAGTVQFTGPLSGAGRTGSLSGAFMSSPTNPIAGQAGNFNISGTGYRAGGTFAAQKQ